MQHIHEKGGKKCMMQDKKNISKVLIGSIFCTAVASDVHKAHRCRLHRRGGGPIDVPAPTETFQGRGNMPGGKLLMIDKKWQHECGLVDDFTSSLFIG